MMKPTPTQALALKTLNKSFEKKWEQPRIHIRIDSYSKKILWATCNYTDFKIRIGTIKVLLNNEWIQKTQPDYDDYCISQKGQSILDLLSARDFIKKETNKPIWNTENILNALIIKYDKMSNDGYEGAPKWVYFSELRNYRWASRIVDFWAMACWGSLNYKRISYEIKITRADFLNELKDPTKREFAMEISNQFFFITPPDLIKREELPDGCGLIELSAEGKLKTKVKAPERNPSFVFTWDFASCLGRKIFKEQQK